MKTLTLDEPGRLRRSETELPGDPPPGHALVRVARVGVCGTDLHAYCGRQPFFEYPRILGHELGVEVLAINGPPSRSETELGLAGPDRPSRGAPGPGDLAAVEPYFDCGTCIACRRGKPNCCTSLRVLGVHIDGGMREEMIVPTHKLHRSESLSLDQLALVETLGIGCHAIDRADPAPGTPTLVIGAGPIGLTVALFAIERGAHVYVLELDARRRKFVEDHLDVAGTLAPGDDCPEQVLEAFDGDLPLLVLDATGNRDSMETAFDLVASGGRLVLVGLVLDSLSFRDPEFHRRELSLLASRNSRPQDFRRILELLEAGHIDTDAWITHRARYEDFVERFPAWLERDSGVVKAVLAL